MEQEIVRVTKTLFVGTSNYPHLNVSLRNTKGETETSIKAVACVSREKRTGKIFGVKGICFTSYLPTCHHMHLA